MPHAYFVSVALSMFFCVTTNLCAGESTPSAKSSQFGAERLDFSIGGRAGFLILPTAPAVNGAKPWIWFAPTFIGSLPDPSHEWMFKQLLAKGFSIGGVDVGEAYGNPPSRKSYTLYYEFIVKTFGMAKKVSLLPQSRGGLLLYNWAAEHPKEVQCIGGIYPVGDLASYPGLAKASNAYGLTEADLRTCLREYNPIDRLFPIAQEKIPVLHLHGNVDKVVPLQLNSGELIRRYCDLGGPGELLVVQGKGHEVCDEFFRSQALVDFFLGKGNPPIPRRQP